MFLIDCPNCGRRNVSEFRWGGEVNPRPADLDERSDKAWADYVYMRENTAGLVREWWHHRMGCDAWFTAERDVSTHEVRSTYLSDSAGRSMYDEEGSR